MIPVPKGFRFAASKAAFKREGRYDLAVMLSDAPAVAAGVFTTNRFQAAPVLQCIETLASSERVRGVVANSGQANACTGEQGLVNCRVSLEMAAGAVGVSMDELLPASTGVIGQHIKLDRWRAALPELEGSLGKVGPMEFTRAIMTTDKFPKLAWATIRHNGQEARVLGMAKGAGMICPNMATMLGFIACDADVEPGLWRDMLRRAVERSFNRITVDGDTSTNDCVLALANGASGLRIGPDTEHDGRQALQTALNEVCEALAYMIVQDAEGGTKVVRIHVVGAKDDRQAELAARAVGNSPLVKTALFGRDANWGRIVAAVGRSGAEFNPDHVAMAIGGITIFEGGAPKVGDIDGLLAAHMDQRDISIEVSLGDGPGEYTLLASDLTVEYIKINADYRT
jgi:glutamate N-acetyltransferase/amino-acid N-acetyltransferase